MNKFLEKLLDGCKFEWVPLNTLTEYEQPTKYIVSKTNYNGKYDIPVLTAGKTFILGYTDEKDGLCKASLSPVIIFDDFTTAKKWVDFDFKVKSSAMKIITSKNENKYLLKYIYYWLDTLPLESVEGDHKRQWISNFAHKRIPIPCPDNPKKSKEIQAEIVRILDSFAQLIAQLIAEYNARKLQYQYYRDELLNLYDKEHEVVTLGEITEINTGQKPLKILDYKTEFNYINAGTSPSGYCKKNNCIGDTVTTPSRGQGGIGYVGYQKNPFWLGPLCYKIQSKDKSILINKYCFYYLQANKDLLLNLKKEGGVPAINKTDLAQLKIPLPSILEQTRIVSILDKFDTLTNSISEGLPREIELRKKQYEYYRDLLFDFPGAPTK